MERCVEDDALIELRVSDGGTISHASVLRPPKEEWAKPFVECLVAHAEKAFSVSASLPSGVYTHPVIVGSGPCTPR